MNDLYRKNRLIFEQLMQSAGIANFSQLSEVSRLSEWEIQRLQFGLLPKMSVESLVKLAGGLGVSVDTLLNMLLPHSVLAHDLSLPQSPEVNNFSEEYQRLQTKLASLETDLQEQFILTSLDLLESWLLFWPTAVVAAQNNPALPALNIIPLVQPVQQLMESWGLKAIASIGEEVPYNPQYHELIEGIAEDGDIVKVRNGGYWRGEQLYLKAKVSQIS